MLRTIAAAVRRLLMLGLIGSGVAVAGAAVAAPFATGLNSPAGLAFDSSGNLYVANAGTNTVIKFSSTGTLINASFATGFSSPLALAFDSAGNLFVANYTSATVSEIVGAAPPPPPAWVLTLSQWALILLAALMAAGGSLVINGQSSASQKPLLRPSSGAL